MVLVQFVVEILKNVKILKLIQLAYNFVNRVIYFHIDGSRNMS